MTPAVVAVRSARIAHRVIEYASAVEHAYGEEAAAALGVDAACVYKTLIAKLDGRALVVALVPVDAELDLKALAAHAGAKRAEMASPRDAERSTGYVVGGISPFGQRKTLRTFVDTGMTRYDQVYVSAGKRGLELEVAPADLIRLCRATSASIARR